VFLCASVLCNFLGACVFNVSVVSVFGACVMYCARLYVWCVFVYFNVLFGVCVFVWYVVCARVVFVLCCVCGCLICFCMWCV